MTFGITEVRLYASQSLDFVQGMFPLSVAILLTSKQVIIL